jgi:glycosyltransferase involved in cell wall biosynthesis
MIKNKILIILPTDNLGGAERVAQNLVLHLAKKEYISVRVYFLSRGNNGHWEKLASLSNVKLEYNFASSELRGLPRMILKFIRNREDYDFVYTTHLHMNALLALLRRLKIVKMKKHIVRESTVIFDRFFGWKRKLFRFMYSLYSNVDLLICQTEYMKIQLLKEIKKLNNIKSKVIRNPVNLEYIDQKLAIKEGTIVNTSFNIIFVGRLIEIKNLTLLLDSLEICFKEGNAFELIVLGDGIQMVELQSKVSKMQSKNHITFKGNVQNPYSYMAQADLGVISSNKEGFPNVLIEMMASGTNNIITTPCAGDLDTLPHIHLLAGHSIDEMANALAFAIKQKIDNSLEYRKYAENIDVEKFWKESFNSI